MESIYENLKGSDTLVVAFQAHDKTIFGTTVDEFKGVLTQLEYDTIKINDITGQYFFSGIDETHNTFEKLVDLLSGFTSDYRKTVFIGNCGGGHAAILFGTLLNVDKVIGFNTASYLDQESMILNNDGREGQLSFLDQSIEYLNLKPYLNSRNYTTQIHSIVAKNTDRHVKQSNNISNCPNVIIEMINCETPQVANYLKVQNLLIPKIISIVES